MIPLSYTIVSRDVLPTLASTADDARRARNTTSPTKLSSGPSSSRQDSATSVSTGPVRSRCSGAHPRSQHHTVGAPTAGRIADRTVVYWRKRRGGEWIPEDRLRAALLGAGLFVPMSVLLAGITIKYVPGTPGIILNLMWLFMNGIGVRPPLPACAVAPSILYSIIACQRRLTSHSRRSRRTLSTSCIPKVHRRWPLAREFPTRFPYVPCVGRVR